MRLTKAEINARYRARHRDRVRESVKRRRALETPEQRAARLATLARYRAAHPERDAADRAVQSSNRRAKRLGIEDRLTSADVLGLWERQPVCVTCGTGRGLDHIVPMTDGGTNTADNIQTMCKPCNTAKENEGRRVPIEAQRERQRAYMREYHQRRRHAATASVIS